MVDEESPKRFLREIEQVIEKAEAEGRPEARLFDLYRNLLDVKGESGILRSAADSIAAVMVARSAVDIVAAERFNDDRAMADTRLKAIIRMAEAILSNAKEVRTFGVSEH